MGLSGGQPKPGFGDHGRRDWRIARIANLVTAARRYLGNPDVSFPEVDSREKLVAEQSVTGQFWRFFKL